MIGPKRFHWQAWAPWLLGGSLLWQVAATVMNVGNAFLDLRVYVLGGAALDHPGTLYDVYYTDAIGGHVGFIYPPFAAMVFYPLHLMPFPIVAVGWTAISVGALYGAVRLSQLLVGGGNERTAMLWTAAALWFEPVRSTTFLGQLGVVLLVAVLYAVYTKRSWLAGVIIGVTGGVKMTPAFTDIYMAGMRRWFVVVNSAVAFIGTVGLSYIVAPAETLRYFADPLHNAVPKGAVAYVCNQSWLGTLSRFVGHDAGGSALVLCTMGVTFVLGVGAWWALGARGGDRDVLASLLVVQLVGLTASPISWSHHWVWGVPLVIWLAHGKWHDARGAVILRWVWIALMVAGIPNLLAGEFPLPESLNLPWYVAVGAAIYAPMTLVTLAWIIATGRSARRSLTAGSAAHDGSVQV